MTRFELSQRFSPPACKVGRCSAVRTDTEALALAALTLISVVFADVAKAAPGPTGPEYPAEEREIPRGDWWESCSDAAGNVTTLKSSCADTPCGTSRVAIVSRHDADGSPLFVDRRISVDPVHADAPGLRLSCNQAGPLVAQWQDRSGCVVHRALDVNGNPRGAPSASGEEGESCDLRPSLAVNSLGDFVGAWKTRITGDEIGIKFRRYNRNGSPKGPVQLIVPARGNVFKDDDVKVALDDNGIAMVVWRREPRGGHASRAGIYAELFDSSGASLGEAFRVNTFLLGEVGIPTVAVVEDGIYEVLWSNLIQGGRVGRRIAAALPTRTSSTTTTTSTTLPLPSDMPQFGGARTLTSNTSSTPAPIVPSVLRSGDATWFIHTLGLDVNRSKNDGNQWEAISVLPDVESQRIKSIESNQNGTLLGFRYGEGGIWVDRSTNDGTVWSEKHSTIPVPEPFEDCGNFRHQRIRAAGSPGGTWVVMWTLRWFSCQSPTYGRPVEPRQDVVYVTRSSDNATSWQATVPIAINDGLGVSGLDLQNDGNGTWVALWADTGLKYARSDDDGRTWSKSSALVSNVACTSCRLHQRYSHVDVASDGSGRWVATFASPVFRSKRYGHDADVFVVRSADNGETWSNALPLGKDAATDRVRDFEPAIAVDGLSHWVLTWRSHRNLPGSTRLDANIFYAVSPDAGETWTNPRVLNVVQAGAVEDATLDSRPTVEADERGVWMAAWTSLDLVEQFGRLTESVMVAAAPAVCGDGRVDVGEQCDDRNNANGDGCDFDCSRTACGNGVVTVGEFCDDANENNDDLCKTDCTGPVCGDGVLWPELEECDDGNPSNTDECTNDCLNARCGDGFWQPAVGEDCDGSDPNSVLDCTSSCRLAPCRPADVPANPERCLDDDPSNDNGCPTHCRITNCGNGIVEDDAEECDDGNDSNTDDCTNECLNARCGDGYLRDGFGEECDDGNRDSGDGCSRQCRIVWCSAERIPENPDLCFDEDPTNDRECPNDCIISVCGDGLVDFGTEDCEPTHPEFGAYCNDDCTWKPACGDANGDQKTTATDVQQILVHSVGAQIACPKVACDMDRSGEVQVPDARLALGAAVGLDEVEECVEGRRIVTLFVENEGVLFGSLQVDLDYSEAAGEFVGIADQVRCQRSAGDFGAINDDDEKRVLSAAVISVEGFFSPTDFVRCEFLMTAGTTDEPVFVVTAVDASDYKLNPVSATVGYRVE